VNVDVVSNLDKSVTRSRGAGGRVTTGSLCGEKRVITAFGVPVHAGVATG
jgi:hypothetical protein